MNSLVCLQIAVTDSSGSMIQIQRGVTYKASVTQYGFTSPSRNMNKMYIRDQNYPAVFKIGL